MKGSTALFVAIIVGYFALEVYVASRNTYRMQPDHIFGEFVSASRAVEVCGPLKPVDRAKFDANYRYARRRAVESSAANGAADPATEGVQEQEDAGRQQVDQLIDDLGCDDIALFKLRKRYENLTRLNLPTQAADRAG
jgi:hypothetical protein